jgi:hypothetical protein
VLLAELVLGDVLVVEVADFAHTTKLISSMKKQAISKTGSLEELYKSQGSLFEFGPDH